MQNCLQIGEATFGRARNHKTILNHIRCWCTFLIKHDLRPQNMSPIDEIDEICRQWTKCHECSSIDR